MYTEPFMGLTIWNLLTDLFDHTALANNLVSIGQHDHSSGKGQQINSAGLANGSVITAKIASSAVTDAQIATSTITTDKLAFVPTTLTAGTLAHRPSAGTLGHIYYATDVGFFYWDTGTVWQSMVATGSGAGALSLAASATGTYAPPPGQFLIASNSGNATLPPAVNGQIVGVMAGASITPALSLQIFSQGSDTIFGVGTSFTTSIQMISPGAFAIFQADGAGHWIIVGGQGYTQSLQNTGWTNLTLGSGVVSVATSAPAVKKIDDIITFRGTLGSASGTITAGTTLATLPLLGFTTGDNRLIPVTVDNTSACVADLLVVAASTGNISLKYTALTSSPAVNVSLAGSNYTF